MIYEFSTMDAKEVAAAVNAMIDDGEFPVMCGMRVTMCGGIGLILPEGDLPLIRGQSFATIGRSTYTGMCAHGCPACEHAVRGTFVTGSTTRFFRGVPIVTFGSHAIHAACCGPNSGIATEAIQTYVDIDEVVALPT